MQHHKPAITLDSIALRLFKRQGLFGRKTVSHWALRDVSFTINRGEVLGIIGRNGAGKSSLLRILARIIDPDTGTINTYGNKTTLLGLQTGFSQELTGRENAIMSGMLMGKTRSEIEERLPGIQNFSELGHWFDKPLATYSSGMRAKLGFSVAINIDSDIILIDEILGVGDATFKEKSATAMRELIKSDKTIILVSHSAPTIKNLSDHAVWIEEGRSILQDTPEVVMEAYDFFTQRYKELKQQDTGGNNISDLAVQDTLRELSLTPENRVIRLADKA